MCITKDRKKGYVSKCQSPLVNNRLAVLLEKIENDVQSEEYLERYLQQIGSNGLSVRLDLNAN